MRPTNATAPPPYASCPGAIYSPLARFATTLQSGSANRLEPVTRLSAYFLPTVKEPPADAEALSHTLLVRAGMIRQLAAGLWTFLPAGWRVHRRVQPIGREGPSATGGQ